MAQPALTPESASTAPTPASLTLLHVPGATAGDADAWWLAEVYQGERLPQLTVRAVLLGAGLGLVMCLSNLYVGLKTGLAFGVAVTAGLLAHSVHGALRRATGGGPLSLLEVSAAQTVASSAGYATGGALVSVNGAYLLVTGHHPPAWTLVAWTLCVSALGVLFAVPLKRQFIDREQLPFPSGTAAAVTVRALHTSGDGGRSRAWALGLGGLVAGGITFVREGLGKLPYLLPLPGSVGAVPLAQLGFGVETGLLAVGSGAMLGLRTTAWLLVGALLCHGVVAPRLLASGVLAGPEAVLGWSLWPGAAALSAASLVHFALQGKALGRALRGLVPGGAAMPSPVEGLQVPRSWFLGGTAVLSLGAVGLTSVAFGVPPMLGALAVGMSFVLCLISCRITGETDVTPSGPLQQVTQLTYGVLQPGNVVTNLMTAGITATTAASAADLLSDLKAGHLLGANPRRQFLAQLLGCVVGAAAVVPLFYLLVPDKAALGEARFPAPAAFMTAGVAEVLSSGLGSLPASAREAAGWAALAGAVLTLAEHLLPERARRWVPSPMGLGLAFLLPASTSFSFFLGGAAAAMFQRAQPEASEKYLMPVAAGLIAGESLVGVTAAVWSAL
ncbi:OPT/YSL family transporter [Myxococcaceae bacterium GXIMD 01537]